MSEKQHSPEAEPKKPSDKKEAGGGDKKEGGEKKDSKKEEGGGEKKDGTKKDEPKSEPKPEPEKPDTKEAEDNDEGDDLGDIVQGHIANVMQKTTKAASLVLFPVPYLTIAGADAILKRVPLVKSLYNVPRSIARGTLAKVRDTIASIGAIPAELIVGPKGDEFMQGVKGQTMKLGSKASGVVRGSLEYTKYGVGRLLHGIGHLFPSKESIGKFFKGAGEVAMAPINAFFSVEGAIDGGVKKLPFLSWGGPLTHIASFGLTLFAANYALSAVAPGFITPIMEWGKGALTGLGVL